MPELVISIGSNLNAAQNLRAAVVSLREQFGGLKLSPVYESEAVGFQGDNFLNLVVAAETALPLTEIISVLKRIENRLGRDRNTPRFADREIDLDVLTYGEEDGRSAGIELPRPEITRNAFVLRPMADLLPDMMHPGTGRRLAQMWNDFDQSSQKLWPVEFDW
ncbi:MAG: 2-amino-4-hydroxy-6-hydroxymethyldihydropteridine diphosphokinase [Gammaproteobacteria bacterium]